MWVLIGRIISRRVDFDISMMEEGVFEDGMRGWGLEKGLFDLRDSRRWGGG